MESLLRIRKIKEDLALGELAKVLTRVNEEEFKKETAEKFKKSEMHEFETEHGKEFDLRLYQMHDRYLKKLDGESAEAVSKMQGMQPDLDAARGKLSEASKQKRVVEKLKERHKIRYNEDIQKAVVKELEAANSLRNNRELMGEETDEYKKRKYVESIQDYIDTKRELEDEQFKEPDPVSEYFKKFGIPDPRKKK